MLKGSLKKIVFFCVVALAGLSQASDFSAPADKIKLKPQNPGVADGTWFDWCPASYPGQSFGVTRGGKMTYYSKGFNFFGYSSTSDVNAFGFWNLDSLSADVHTVWNRSWSYAACMTLYNNGRLFVGDGPYSNNDPNKPYTTPNELITVNGEARVVSNLDAHSISLGLSDPNARPPATHPANIIRPAAVAAPSTAGAVDGDLCYDSDANLTTGALSGGSGAWVMFDSTPPAAWHVIKTF